MYFLLQAWQILLHLREYAGFYVLQHCLEEMAIVQSQWIGW